MHCFFEEEEERKKVYLYIYIHRGQTKIILIRSLGFSSFFFSFAILKKE